MREQIDAIVAAVGGLAGSGLLAYVCVRASVCVCVCVCARACVCVCERM